MKPNDPKLEDPLWRLQNLYSIKREDTGRIEPFRPRAEQLEVLTSLINEPHVPLYIIKSRRLGMSTAVDLMMADCAVWNDGFQGSLVDQTQSDAERKMSEIIRFGVTSMPREITDRLELPKRNNGELQIKIKGSDESTSSRIFAGKNPRGGTNNFLHISEWGPIAATDPTRSREIRTGGLPSARLGRRVVETTWYGGKGGDLWELVKPILEANPNAEGRVLFFPWHGDPACVKVTGQVDAETEDYFRELAMRLGRTFSREQKQWYTAKKIEQGIFVKREYPSTLDEAMTAPVQGSIYGRLIDVLRAEHMVKPFPVDGAGLVHTFWDEGSPMNTVVWYAQFLGNEIHIIDCDICPQTDDENERSRWDMTAVQRVAHIKSKGYNLGNHYLTHAAQQTEKSGKTYATQLLDAGLPNIRVVPRTADIWSGINELRQIMPRMMFRMPACTNGLDALENYHTRRSTTSGMAVDEPVHDWSSHAADGLRTLAEALMAGIIDGGSSIARQRRRNGLKPRTIMNMGGSMSQPRSRVGSILGGF